MSTTTNRVVFQADVTQFRQQLNRLEGQVQQLNDSFGGLRDAIAGIAIGAFVTNAVNATVSMKNLSDATGIAAQSVFGISQAFAAAGGTTDRAIDGISDLIKNLGDAARGSSELQKAFAQVGVSLDDLRTMSEEQVLKATIEGLANLDNAAQRTSLAMQLMGESVKGVDLQSVNRSMNEFISGSRDIATAATAAQQAQTNLTIATDKLGQALVTALGPLLEFVANMNPQQMDAFISAIAKLGAGLLALGGAVKVFGWITTAIAAMGAAWVTATALFRTGSEIVGTTIGRARGQITGFSRAFAAASTVGGKFAAIMTTFMITMKYRIPFLLQGLARMTPLLGGLTAAAWLANTAMKELFDIDLLQMFRQSVQRTINDILDIPFLFRNDRPVRIPVEVDYDQGETQRMLGRFDEVNARAQEQNTLREVVVETENQIAQAIQQQIQTLRQSFVEYKRINEEVVRRMRFENSMIGATERQREVAQTAYDMESQYLNEINALIDDYITRKARGNQEDLAVLPEIERQIQAITDQYQQQIDIVNELTIEKMRLQEIERDRLEMEQRLQNIAEFGMRSQIENADRLRNIQDDIARMTMTDIERAYYDIERAADNAALAAIRAEEARRGEPLDPEEVEAYYRAARRGVDDLRRATERHNELSRSWSTGWRRALNEYVDNATNAARRAEQIFGRMTSGLEDMIVNFARTGKLSWREFVADMLETLMRSQLQSVMANIFSPGGILGGVGNLFGGLMGGGNSNTRGQNASNPLFVADVTSGGAVTGGGGLMGTIGSILNPQQPQQQQRPQQQPTSGIWDTVRNIGSTVGNALGGAWNTVKKIGSSVGGAVSNVFSSVSRMFGGFFANGGLIPAGKFGVVGERGPELISGPANITPMAAGGVTNVYYNISAVDTQSFQQALARDPSFIYALTEQARQRQPGGRR